jgi:hypothetical protein
MKLRLLSFLAVPAAAAVVACVSIACSGSSSAPGGGNGNGGGDGGISPSDPPHALGVIMLGETHVPAGGSATPIVSAAFAPDSTKLSACSTTVAGCTIPMLPKCDGPSGVSACPTGQACVLGDDCLPKCQAVCTLTCGSDEECYFATPTSPACRKREDFNAGALAFAGTTTPITLYPPYAFTGETSGAPFLAGAQIEVQGSGATVAGFDKFDETFHATTFVQTVPALDKLPLSQVWGAGPIPVGWAPGADSIVVDVTGPQGTAECPADDASGHFDVPRAVVQAVTGTSSQELSISVTRKRVETKKDGHTKGTLSTATVQPVGFLQLVTTSSESASFAGCSAGQTMCGDHCADLTFSATDCGACGHACTGGAYCSSGVCVGGTTTCSGTLTMCNGLCVDTTTSATNCGSCGHVCGSGQTCAGSVCSGGTTTTCATCASTAESGTCATQYAKCQSNTSCTALGTCIGGCAAGDTTCRDNCYNANSAGYTDLSTLQSCICTTACSSSCTGDAFCSAI